MQLHSYVGIWVTADGRIRQELLANGCYDEARDARKSAYQGRYELRGDHIDYWDDTGFTADGTFVLGDLDIFQHLFVLRVGGDGANLGFHAERISHARGACERQEFFDKLVMNGTVDQGPGTCDAGLTGRGKNTGDDAFHGLIHFGIFEHDVG